jgi:hypothetical protein
MAAAMPEHSRLVRVVRIKAEQYVEPVLDRRLAQVPLFGADIVREPIELSALSFNQEPGQVPLKSSLTPLSVRKCLYIPASLSVGVSAEEVLRVAGETGDDEFGDVAEGVSLSLGVASPLVVSGPFGSLRSLGSSSSCEPSVEKMASGSDGSDVSPVLGSPPSGRP